MMHAAARSVIPEDEGSFRVSSQSLFGHISQRFLDHSGSACRLATTRLGRCQMTDIRARAHGVLGERVVRNSYDIDAVKVIMQVEGLTRFKQNGERRLLGPGGLLMYDPTRSYALLNTTSVHQVVFQVPREMFADCGLARLIHPHLFEREVEGLPYIVASVLAATAREIDALAESARTRIGDTLTRLIATLVSGDGGLDHSGDAAPLEILRGRVTEFIDENLGNPELSIDMVTAALKCSKRYIHRAFEGTGTTPERYMWEARLEQCRQDLLSSQKRLWTISEIAFACGFNSSAHFSRAFRSRFGMTPREFRSLSGLRTEQWTAPHFRE